MAGPLSIYDFILIDDKFDDIREPMSILVQKYNKTHVNFVGIRELLESDAYDAFINGDHENTQSVCVTAGLLKEPIDLKLSIIENIFSIAGVEISTSVHPAGYDYLLVLASGLHGISAVAD
jgi:hypothetical protein